MIRSKKLTVVKLCVVFVISLLGFNTALAQCTQTVYTYASSQTNSASSILGDASVDSPNQAVGSNLTDYSTLNGGTLGTATEFLQFASTVTSGTSVTVKLSLPSGLLSVLGGITIQPYLGTGSASSTAVGSSVNPNPTLLNVLNGAGDIEITLTPTGNYDGVWVRLSGIAIGNKVNIYGAFTSKTVSGSGDCGIGVDVLSGTRALVSGVSLLNTLSSVTNPGNAIDNDLTTAASINSGLTTLAYAYHTTVFNTLSQPGDFVRMLLQDPSGGLLTLGSLSNVTVQLYNGITAVGSPISTSSGLLSLSLFPGDANKRYLNIIPPDNTPFDRVEIRGGGLADVQLSQGLQIFDVKRVMAAPTSTINGTPIASTTICAGSTAALSVVATAEASCTTYNWYNVPTGGTSLQTGTSYTPPAAGLVTGANDFYVEVTRTGCTNISDRTKVTINVNALPNVPTVPSVTICDGDMATLAVTSPDASLTYNWYNNLTDVTPAVTGNTLTTAALHANTSYYVEAVNSTTTCASSTRTKADIIVNPLPAITPGPQPQACTGIGGPTALSFTSTNAPNSYSIVWDAAAHTANFIDVSNSSLPPSPGIISIAVPSTAASAIYYGTITVKNANGCISNPGQPISIQVYPTPSQPIVNIAH